MRKLILALLTGAYVCTGLIVWLLIWRNGGGVPAGVASFIGTLGLAFAFHGLIERALDSNAIRNDIGALREAHLILVDQIEKLDARVTQVVETVADEALRRSDELTSEVHQLEDMVQKMSYRLEDQLVYHVEAAQETRGCATPWRGVGSTSTCNPRSACRSVARCSTRASRGCETRPAG